MAAKCPRCEQRHPGDEVCFYELEDRYGKNSEPSETMADTVERDRNE